MNLDFRRGDRLTAEAMQEIVRRLDRLEGVEGSGRLQTRRGGLGPLQISYVEGMTRGFGKASGAITARSGTTAGTGTVDVWWNNAGTLGTTGVTVDVFNVGTLISDTKYVWIEQDSFGDFYVSPMECE